MAPEHLHFAVSCGGVLEGFATCTEEVDLIVEEIYANHDPDADLFVEVELIPTRSVTR